MDRYQGTWLMIRDANTYCSPEFIEFQNDEIIHFELLEKTNNGLLEKKQHFIEKLSETKHKFVSKSRIRMYRMGKKLTVISDTESISEDIEFLTDYERIEPTKTNLTDKEIEKLRFNIEWNGEFGPLVFNTCLDSPAIQEVNKRLKRKGQKFVLEQLQGTYFASIYDNGNRQTLIGIKEIDEEKAVLFGFPETPYKVAAKPIR
ncbi:hypothetical protein [Flagellimonas onchidii]|uniref:hypothetical protein n=1 Tax=Flagellimonas onchidii TaxID=2562684 RepID=UPI0010A5C1E1|nr:hypothetical protein [Allomuricauda onchidii]